MKYYFKISTLCKQWSLPSWERGLKFVVSGLSAPVVLVAPLVGAWIEIYDVLRILVPAVVVAPLVGAWIEITLLSSGRCPGKPSLPSWERGLKLQCHSHISESSRVAPLVGAWIEITSNKYIVMGQKSRSPRGSVD